MILRDIDILERINEKAKTVVQMTLTTADDELCKKIEENVCPTSERIKVLEEMRKRNIPTVVWLCPILPFINDTEENLMKILELCKKCDVKGIINFGFGLTLREGNREYFYQKLEKNFPGKGLFTLYNKYFRDSYNCGSHEETGRHYLLEIIRFFLDHGYDLTTNNGRHGAEALRALCWSTCDGAILDAAKLLLEAGADPLVRNGDGNTVLDTIRWKISGCVPVHDDREREALFTALYKLVESTVC